MEKRKVNQQILDKTLDICLSRKISLINIIKKRKENNKDQETNRKLLTKAKKIEKAMQTIKEEVYDSC